LVVRGRWPRAIFYDSKGTLFNWAWTWQKTAEELVSRYAPEVSAKEFYEVRDLLELTDLVAQNLGVGAG
jgi:hypothetical protein